MGGHVYQERAAILRKAGDLWNEHAEEIQGWIMRETGADPAQGAAGDLVRRQHLLRGGGR